MRDEVRAMLLALGDGGTVELAERAVACAELTCWSQPAGLQEVSVAWGVSKSTIGHWLAGRRPAPDWYRPPKWELSTGPVWDLTDFPMRGSKTQ